LKEIYETYLPLQDLKDIKSTHFTFVERDYENSTLIEDVIIEKIKNG